VQPLVFGAVHLAHAAGAQAGVNHVGSQLQPWLELVLPLTLLRRQHLGGFPHRRAEQCRAGPLRGEQRFHLAAEFFIFPAGFSQESRPLSRLALPSRMEQLFDLAETFRGRRLLRMNFSTILFPLLTGNRCLTHRGPHCGGHAGSPCLQAEVNQVDIFLCEPKGLKAHFEIVSLVPSSLHDPSR
jgi:hypothetical protein